MGTGPRLPSRPQLLLPLLLNGTTGPRPLSSQPPPPSLLNGATGPAALLLLLLYLHPKDGTIGRALRPLLSQPHPLLPLLSSPLQRAGTTGRALQLLLLSQPQPSLPLP